MKTFLKPALAGLVSCALMSGAAWAESHADMSWTESKYGPDDEIGAANLRKWPRGWSPRAKPIRWA